MLAPVAETSQSITAPITVRSAPASNTICFTVPTTSIAALSLVAQSVLLADECPLIVVFPDSIIESEFIFNWSDEEDTLKLSVEFLKSKVPPFTSTTLEATVLPLALKVVPMFSYNSSVSVILPVAVTFPPLLSNTTLFVVSSGSDNAPLPLQNIL